MKGKLFLIHWKQAEAEELAKPLRAAGWQVEIEAEDGARAGQRILADPPQAVVIYLTRLPSHGRETAHALRSYKAGREIPILFVDGESEKVEKVRFKVPDAAFLRSAELQPALDSLVQAG
jgi:DNA-binding response OmpR family regulator